MVLFWYVGPETGGKVLHRRDGTRSSVGVGVGKHVCRSDAQPRLIEASATNTLLTSTEDPKTTTNKLATQTDDFTNGFRNCSSLPPPIRGYSHGITETCFGRGTTTGSRKGVWIRPQKRKCQHLRKRWKNVTQRTGTVILKTFCEQQMLRVFRSVLALFVPMHPERPCLIVSEASQHPKKPC